MAFTEMGNLGEGRVGNEQAIVFLGHVKCDMQISKQACQIDCWAVSLELRDR